MRKLAPVAFCVLAAGCATHYQPTLHNDNPGGGERVGSGDAEYGQYNTLAECEKALAVVIEAQKEKHEAGVTSYGPISRGDCKEMRKRNGFGSGRYHDLLIKGVLIDLLFYLENKRCLVEGREPRLMCNCAHPHGFSTRRIGFLKA